jgi:hypothetical protein
MRFNGRNGSPADSGDLDIGSQRGSVAPARAAGAALTCSRVPGRVKRARLPSGTRPGTQRKDREAPHRLSDPSCRSWVPGLAALARDTSVRSRGAQSEPLAVVSNSRCQTAQCCSFPRRVVAPGLVSIIRTRPEEGWAERRQAHLSCCRVCETRPSARVRRGASHDAGRSPLGAPPWRFSAGGRASISGISSGSVQRCSSQPGRHAWRAVSRTSRARGYEPRPQDATPRSAYRTVSGRRPS